MQYREYRAVIDGKAKKFGILGECHVYTREESYFARRILEEYDFLVAEGIPDPHPLNTALAQLAQRIPPPRFTPKRQNKTALPELTYAELLRRWAEDQDRTHPTAKTIARENKRAVIPLEQDFPFKPPALDRPFTLNGKTYTPSEFFSEQHWHKIRTDASYAKTILAAFTHFLSNGDAREEIIAFGSATYLRHHTDRLLLICGEKHLAGIERRLADTLALKIVRSETR